MFRWKEEYRIDGGAIDKEHQHLLELASQVVAFFDPMEQKEAVKDAVRELFQYVEYHFANEEQRMFEAGFPEYESHVQKHKEIVNEMNLILKECRDIKILVADLRQLMVKWVIEHIMEEDKKFSAHLLLEKS